MAPFGDPVRGLCGSPAGKRARRPAGRSAGRRCGVPELGRSCAHVGVLFRGTPGPLFGTSARLEAHPPSFRQPCVMARTPISRIVETAMVAMPKARHPSR